MIESRAPAVIVSYSKHAQLTVLRRIPFTWRQICESVPLAASPLFFDANPLIDASKHMQNRGRIHFTTLFCSFTVNTLVPFILCAISE